MAIFTITVDQVSNQPPNQIGNNTNGVLQFEDNIYNFSIEDFTTNTVPIYEDPEGDEPLNIKITSLPAIGVLKYNNVDITLNQNILASNINLLTYVIDNTVTTGYSITFNFTISDVGSGQYYQGNDALYKLSITPIVNQPAISGDKEFNILNTEELFFTTNNFTTETIPEYSDPENDPADKLKIITLPTLGTLNYNNTPVNINQIISFEDINLGLFSYTPDVSAPYVISFEFKIADTGSGIFA